MDAKIRKQADQFIREESQFHLGFLPTEQSNPLTRDLAADCQRDPQAGVRSMQRVDRNVLTMAKEVLASTAYAKLLADGEKTIRQGGRIVFSGCGATGRLSILLESMWRDCCANNAAAAPYADQVESIMTGGDVALVRSVEFFEDYTAFGRCQVEDAQLSAKDMLVAITEGGETSSVLGSVDEALARGAAVFLLFNNPAELLAERLERSRRAIRDPRVCVLDLSCGPMAVAGSTRMQATTAEQLIAGAALESVMQRLLQLPLRDYAADFAALLDSLEEDDNVQAIADYMLFEAEIYRAKGKVTYFVNDFMLDIFTDTTERSPTFMLPPFRRLDQPTAPAPWAFVKNPLADSAEVWARSMHRPLRCLNWSKADYEAMGAAQSIREQPPAVSAADLLQFPIGAEALEERCDHAADAAVLLLVKDDAALRQAYAELRTRFPRQAVLTLNTASDEPGAFCIKAADDSGALQLMRHLALKLVLNTVSTGTMALLGRITGNWMSWVDCTNKKLLDRGARLLVELAEVDYRQACVALFTAQDVLKNFAGEKPSPVQLAMQWLQRRAPATLAEFLHDADEGWQLAVGKASGEAPQRYSASEMQQRSCEFSENGKKARLRWQGHAQLGEGFCVSVDWMHCEDGRFEGRWECSGYAGDEFIEEVHFPVVRAPFDRSSRLLLGGWDMGVCLQGKTLPAAGATRGSGIHSMQFNALLNTLSPSLYVDHRDPDWFTKAGDFTVAKDDSSVSYSGIFRVPIAAEPSRAVAVPYPSSVAYFVGDWFDAAQLYKPWACAQSWWAKRSRDNPMRDVAIWVWNRGLIEDVLPTTEQLQRDAGVPVALDWYWWHHNPYDTDYPNFWPPREGVEPFRAAVKRLRDQGIYSQVYINGVCWDLDGVDFEDGGRDGVIMQRDGQLQAVAFNKYNQHRLAFMCGEAPAFHDRISALLGELQASGLHGQYLDMIGCASYGVCYNSSHSHDKGGGNYSVQGYRRLLQRLRQEYPDFPLTTETSHEAYMDLFDGSIICNSVSSEHLGIVNDTLPLFTAVYHGKYAFFGSYAHPDGIPPWDPKWPDADRWQYEQPWHRLYPDQFYIELARSVAWGSQPMVCHIRPGVQKDPEFAEIYRFILDTARFYHAHREFLFDGQMLSPGGFICERRQVSFMARMIFTKEADCRVHTKEQPAILHSCWQAPDGRRALILANYGGDEQPWSFHELQGSMPPRSYAAIELP
jgi:N-acetylmuramic acid 6-phosphate etherase